MKPYNNKKTKANLYIHFEKMCFYVGEYIKGNLEINNNSRSLIKDIIIEIYITEDWKFKDGIKSDSNKNRIKNYKLNLIDKGILEVKDEENLILPIGITLIPFNFRFSENNTPCFEYPSTDVRCFIRYSFVAYIDSFNTTGYGSSPLFLLSRPVMEVEKNLNLSCTQSIKKWKFLGEGNTTLKVSIPENNYKYDSECKMNIEIDNSRGKISTKEFKVTLLRTLTFKNKKGEIVHKESKKIKRQIVKIIAKPGEIKFCTHNLTFIEDNLKSIYNYKNQANPYNASIEKINFFMPTVKGNFIICDYNIKISLYFESFVDKNHRPRVNFPIYLVHQLPVDYQLEIQEQIEMANALKLSKREEEDLKFARQLQFMFDKKENISKSYNANFNNKNKSYNNINNNVNLDFNKNKSQDNFNQNNEEEDDDLPSLELIEKQHKENEKLENDLQEKKIENFNEVLPFNPNDNEGAPAPFVFNQNNDELNKININQNNNNYYPDFNENYNNINEDNNIKKKGSDKFTLFNDDDEENNNKENYYDDINAI